MSLTNNVSILLVLPSCSASSQELTKFIDGSCLGNDENDPTKDDIILPKVQGKKLTDAFAKSQGAICRYLTPSLWPSRASFRNYVQVVCGLTSEELSNASLSHFTSILSDFFVNYVNIATQTVTDIFVEDLHAISSLLLAQPSVHSPPLLHSITATQMSSMFIMADGTDFKPTERCLVARGVPVDNVLCNGRTAILDSPDITFVADREKRVREYLSDVGTMLRQRRTQNALGTTYTIIGRPGAFGTLSLKAINEAWEGSSDVVQAMRSSAASNTSFALYGADLSSASSYRMDSDIPVALFLTPKSVDTIIHFIETHNLFISGGDRLHEGHIGKVFECLQNCLHSANVSILGRTNEQSNIDQPIQNPLVSYFSYLVSDQTMDDGVAERLSSLTSQALLTVARNLKNDVFPNVIKQRCYARIGLMGNPSDNFNGKCISLTIKNFWVDVALLPTPTSKLVKIAMENTAVTSSFTAAYPLRLLPNPFSDQNAFGSFADLYSNSSKEGYSGGLRLIQATCKKVFEYVERAANGGEELYGTNKGTPFSGPQQESAADLLNRMKSDTFSLAYHTNIPRQVGLAGSSCIVVAVLKAICRYYQITIPSAATSVTSGSFFSIPQSILPSIALSVESQELGIAAGLQDRAVQIFEGLVAMDFSKAHLDATGCGVYKQFGVQFAMKKDSSNELLPPLYLAVARDPSDSGKMHANIKQRYEQADPEVVGAARKWASFVDGTLASLGLGWGEEDDDKEPSATDLESFCNYIDANCQLRRELYTDPCLGKKNLEMMAIAHQHGAAAKFPGSGGAMLVVPRKGRTDVVAMQRDLEAKGYFLIRIVPHFPNTTA